MIEHKGEADSTVQHLKGVHMSPTGAVLLRRGSRRYFKSELKHFVYFYFLFQLTAKMEDYMSKLKNFFKKNQSHI